MGWPLPLRKDPLRMGSYATAVRRRRRTTLQSLRRQLSQLTHLDLHSCRKVTDNGMTTICSSLRLLRHLHLLGCTGIGDRSLTRIAEDLTQLKYLNLFACSKITDAGLLVVVTNLFNCRRCTYGHAVTSQMKVYHTSFPRYSICTLRIVATLPASQHGARLHRCEN